VSPDAVAEQLTAVPTVPVAAHVTVTDSGVLELIVMVADAAAVFPLASVAVTVTV
jgi:hypothetical protein